MNEADETGLLDLIHRIRVAVGDPDGRLMQDELVERCRELADGEECRIQQAWVEDNRRDSSLS